MQLIFLGRYHEDLHAENKRSELEILDEAQRETNKLVLSGVFVVNVFCFVYSCLSLF